MSYEFIELFAGIGGFRLGFEEAGCKCVFASDWDKYAQKTYEANFGEKPSGDTTKIKESDIPRFDILTGGFPCQPFSTLGDREGFEHATQGTLFYDVLRILKHHKPKAFLLENVPGLISHSKGETFKTVIASLEDLEYQVHHKIIDSSLFGVPQKRKRVFIAGFIDKSIKFNWPKPTVDKPVGIGSFVEKDVQGFEITEYYQKSYLFKKDDGRPMVIDQSTTKPVNTLMALYYKLGRLTGIYVKDGSTGLRKLTPNECKAIMGFPKDFVVPVSNMQMYKQFGNSVVVPVIAAVAKEMVKSLDSKE
jgi:DNA (cytosine-5)-methyltransferase 1